MSNDANTIKIKGEVESEFSYQQRLRRANTIHLRRYSAGVLRAQLKNTKLTKFDHDLIRKELRIRPKGPRHTKPKKR